MKIYTKTGDKGDTGIFSGERKSKADAQIESYGSVDELNSFLGWSLCASEPGELQGVLLQIQHDLHVVGADLATPLKKDRKIERTSESRTQRLESHIDRFESDLKPLTQFILAGGGELGSRLHICRTVARRAEREAVRFSESSPMNQEVIRYLNRLSDLLFVMARWANHQEGISDQAWDQSR